MRHRFSLLLLITAAFIFLCGTLLFGGIPDGAHRIWTTPTKQQVQEEPGAVSEPFAPAVEISPAETAHNYAQADTPSHSPLTKPVAVTITETGGSHDEVVAALVHSFGSVPEVKIDLYQLLPRYGIKDVMKAFSLSHPIKGPRGPGAFKEGVKTDRPDIFVAGTCELDIKSKGNGVKTQLDELLKDGKTFLICVVHHADRWGMPEQKLEEAILPWLEKGLVEFWTLSPHTAKFLVENSMSKWAPTVSGNVPVVKHFVPVFPVALQDPPSESGAEKEEMSFAMQGDYDPTRRDYRDIFAQMSSFIAQGSSDETNVALHLIGHGPKPNVPDDIKDAIIFDERTQYGDFYNILSKTFALLPGFANAEYLDRKASSSVPAALIAGTPIVAQQSLLDAYSYVTKDVVWLQDPAENDMAVVGRVLALTPNERRGKKQLVRKRCAEIIKGNTLWVEDRISVALETMGKLKA